MKFMWSLVLLLSVTNAFALHVSSFSPEGNSVDTGAELIFNFEGDVSALGKTSDPVLPEQLAKISIKPAIKCNWKYGGTKTLKCTPQEKLVPATEYEVKVAAGMQGHSIDERTAQDAVFKFKTNELSIISYNVNWNDIALNGRIILNYAVKSENVSGKIQCDSTTIAVKPKVSQEGKVQVVTFTAEPKAIAGKSSCVFYFDKPLTLMKYPINGIPKEKVVLDKEVQQVSSSQPNNSYNYQRKYYAYCNSNQYNNNLELVSFQIPQITCEHSDTLVIDVPIRGEDIRKYVKVTPAHSVKIGDDYGARISGFRPGATYIITISKAASKELKKDLVVQLDAIDSPPLLGSKKPYGVIEKDGPIQVPYSALNIKSTEVTYSVLNTPSDLGKRKNLESSAQELKEKFTLTMKLNENENTLLPFELKNILKMADAKSGLVAGFMEVKDVEPRFQEAETALVNSEYGDYRRKFNFGFLVTDIGLHMKVGERGVLVWATSLKTGKPISDLEITLYQNGAEKSEARTDKKGLAYFEDIVRSDSINVVAKRDDDISFLSTDYFWQRGISLYDFNLTNYYEHTSSTSNLVADVVSERPLYLPNEKVELKFFVREDATDSLDYKKPGQAITVMVHDSRGEEIFKTSPDLNKFGTAAIKFQLDPKAATGDYTVYLTIGNNTATFPKAFMVHEFRKPEIKVAMSERADAYEGKVTYYSGGDMKNAEGQLALIFKSSHFKPTDALLKKFSYPAEVGGRSYEWEDYYSSYESSPEVLSRKEITTDEFGTFEVSKAEAMEAAKKYGQLTIEAIFKDSAGGSVAGRVSTLINPYKYIPGINLEGWYHNVGDKLNPKVVAIDSKGVPAMGVKMVLEVKHINWIYERRLGSGNYYYYDSRREEKLLKKCDFVTNQLQNSCDIKIEKGGQYQFTVQTKAQSGLSPAIESTWVMEDGGFYGYRIENHDRINISVENNDLKVGDKVRLMALAPFSDGEALITFERDGIIHREQVAFKGNVLIYEKTLDSEKYIPGFYASVVMVKGRTSDKIDGEVDLGKPQFKIGYARVDVKNAPKRLAVAVTPESNRAKPGEMMEVTVEVKDYKGKGSYSELAIAVVDDSLLSLAGNYKDNYDILDTFYTLKKPKVNNYQTLTQLIGRRTYGKKGASPGGGGGMALRTDFKNTAYWVAQVETDKKGRHKFKFKIPDNLTTWKILAVSVDENHRFGFGEGEFLATKPLTVEPVLPNFLLEGDKFLAQVSVANRSGEKQDILVTAMSKSLSITKNESKLSLDDGGRSSLVFPMEANVTKTADLTFTADAGDHKDGFMVNIPVERYTIQHVSFMGGTIKDKPVTIPVSLPGEARKDSVNLNVEYSSTAMNGLDETFQYVLGYPYGCWEQRLSKAYFLVQYEQFKNIISYRFPETQGSIKDAVQKLLDLAPDYQTASGGMQYYPNPKGEADSYLSIFTAYSFNIMKKVGYKINPDVESKLKNYLRGMIMSDSGWNQGYEATFRNSNKALILTVLAEMGEKNLNAVGSKLYSQKESLDLFALSFLGGFLNSTKGFEAEAKTVFTRLDSLKDLRGAMMSFKEPLKTNDDWKWWNYTDTRSQCAALQNLVPFTNDKSYAANLVREILSRMKQGRWYNTQENMYCFEGLRRFVEKFESNIDESDLAIKLDGNKVDKAPVKKQNVRAVNLTPEELTTIPKKIEIESTKKHELYYSTTLRYETPYVERGPTNNGFELKKFIYKKTPNGYQELKGKILNAKRGDTLKIVLHVSVPTKRYQVMLNDRLAACFEPINMELATSSQADGADVDEAKADYDNQNDYYDDDGEYWTPWYKGKGFSYMDLRLNAAQFYSKQLRPGNYTVEYLVQVRTAGEFTLPESTVEEMYYPEVRGTFSGKKVIVAE